MKTFLCCLVAVQLLSQAYGLLCYSCSDTNFNGESTANENCFTTTEVAASRTTNVTCPADSSPNIFYCRTRFTLQDGIVTGVLRGCTGTTSDEDENTNSVPGNNKCTTVLDASGNPTDQTNCYYHCTTDVCNTISTSSLVACSSDCNIGVGGGSCNYVVGTCVCNSGFSGSDCTTIVTTSTSVQRRCVQCNSLTDTNCASSTTSVDCPSTETYCSTTTTSIYNPSDAVIRTVVTRGCTAAFRAVDECAFTDIYTDPPINSSPDPGYNEFTCYSTCDTDGCNTNTADGIVNGNEAQVLQCVQCSDTTGSGVCDVASTRSACPSGSTHCQATVTYLLSDKVDLSFPEAEPAYKLVSNVRECATAAVTAQCTTSSIGSLSLNKVTCTETCQGDGCNTGWPVRPKCITCNSYDATSNYEDGYDACIENPPVSADCATPFQEYCYISEFGIEKDTGRSVKGYPHIMVRGCSHVNLGTGCSSATLRSTEIENCNRTCTTDGCNVGSGGSVPLQTMVTLFAPVMMGWLAQHYY